MRNPWYSIFYIKSPVMKILAGTISLIIALLALGFQLVVEEPRMAAQTRNWDGRSIEKGAEIYKNNCANCHGGVGQGGINVAPPLNSKHFFEERLKEVGYTGSVTNYVKLTVAGGRPVKSRPEWAANMPTWGTRYGGPLRDDQVDHITTFVMNWRSTAISQTAEQDPWNSVVKVMDATAKAEADAKLAAAASGAPIEPRKPEALFVSMACAGCHKLDLDQTAATIGVPGPNMKNLPETAATKVAGLSAAEYVYQSIVEPNAYVNEGYVAGVMLQDFKTKMSEEEIQSLVAWILDPNRVMP